LTKTMAAGDSATVPATIQASLTARLDRLGSAKEVAQTGAVIGRTFAHDLLALVSNSDPAALDEAIHRLVDAELLFQRGTPPDARYTFKHALVQDAAYESLLKSKRQQMHGRIATVLEGKFPEWTEAEPELLAHHYTEAGSAEQAIEYWRRAGDRALERSANVEAVAHFTKGLELLAALPDSGDRAQQELALQVPLASALTSAKGHAAPETGRALMRARELCREVGYAPQMFEVLYGVWNYIFVGGDLHAALELAEEGFELVRHEGTRTRRAAAHCMLGQTLFFLGRFDRAQDHLEKSIALYAPEEDRSLGLVYGEHPGIVSLGFLNLVLQLKGFPEQAIAQSREPFDQAEEASHALSTSVLFLHAVTLRCLRREPKEAQEIAQSMIKLSNEQTLPMVEAHGTMLGGWALAELGRPEEGIVQMRRGLAEFMATGAEIYTPLFLALLAEGYQRCGKFEECLKVLNDAFDVVHRNGDDAWKSELERNRGACLLSISSNNVPEAEAAFRRALEVANSQNAISLELRAATSLARLWQNQGKTAEARELLAPVYDRFTEGFDTVDLKEAKSLLDELS
jgi:predicted ATPase